MVFTLIIAFLALSNHYQDMKFPTFDISSLANLNKPGEVFDNISIKSSNFLGRM